MGPIYCMGPHLAYKEELYVHPQHGTVHYYPLIPGSSYRLLSVFSRRIETNSSNFTKRRNKGWCIHRRGPCFEAQICRTWRGRIRFDGRPLQDLLSQPDDAVRHSYLEHFNAGIFEKGPGLAEAFKGRTASYVEGFSDAPGLGT